MLSLPEKLIILAHDDQSGTMSSNAYAGGAYSYGIMGAILLELAVIRQKLSFDNNKFNIKDGSTTGDELLDEALKIIGKSNKSIEASEILGLLTWRMSNAYNQMCRRFTDNGIFRVEEKRFLGLFPNKRYYLTDESVRQRLVEQIRDILLGGKERYETEEVLLISLINTCNFIDNFFSKEEKKSAKAKSAEVANFDGVCKSTNDAIVSTVNDAALAAIFAATTTVMMSSSSD